MAYCTGCGHLISDAARFCRACGAQQDAEVEQECQPNTAAQTPSGAPEHAAVTLFGKHTATISSFADALNDEQHSGVAGGSNPPEHKLPMVKCPHCSHTNPNDYTFCMKCGKPIKGRAMEAAVANRSSVVRCPFCAEEIAADAKKCKHCGEFIGMSGSASAAFSGSLKELSSYYQAEFQQMRDSGEEYRGKWNWAAFFFPGFWAISKGLWKSGLVFFIGSLFTAGIVGIIYWFIFGARGNYMYYRKVVKRQEPWI